jgi:hypothetical protein
MHRASRQCLALIHLHDAVAIPIINIRQHANIPLQAAKVARVSARVAPSVTARFFVTTSRVSLSLLFDVSLVVVVSSVFQPVSIFNLVAMPDMS